MLSNWKYLHEVCVCMCGHSSLSDHREDEICSFTHSRIKWLYIRWPNVKVIRVMYKGTDKVLAAIWSWLNQEKANNIVLALLCPYSLLLSFLCSTAWVKLGELLVSHINLSLLMELSSYCPAEVIPLSLYCSLSFEWRVWSSILNMFFRNFSISYLLLHFWSFSQDIYFWIKRTFHCKWC